MMRNRAASMGQPSPARRASIVQQNAQDVPPDVMVSMKVWLANRGVVYRQACTVGQLDTIAQLFGCLATNKGPTGTPTASKADLLAFVKVRSLAF